MISKFIFKFLVDFYPSTIDYLYTVIRDLEKQIQHPIDIVIAWVDGADPLLQEKRARFLKPNESFSHPGAAQTRFHSLNEVVYCVLSILKFSLRLKLSLPVNASFLYLSLSPL